MPNFASIMSPRDRVQKRFKGGCYSGGTIDGYGTKLLDAGLHATRCPLRDQAALPLFSEVGM
jgi:hypothetical protein